MNYKTQIELKFYAFMKCTSILHTKRYIFRLHMFSLLQLSQLRFSINLSCFYHVFINVNITGIYLSFQRLTVVLQ